MSSNCPKDPNKRLILDFSVVPLQEAYEHRKRELQSMSLRAKNIKTVVLKKEGGELVYSPEQALQSMDAFMQGNWNRIGDIELKVTRMRLAYERCNNR